MPTEVLADTLASWHLFIEVRLFILVFFWDRLIEFELFLFSLVFGFGVLLDRIVEDRVRLSVVR